MMAFDIYNEKKLSAQLESQKRLSWDLEKKIDWSIGVDLSKPLLPLDKDNIIFPKANSEERLVISQLMGLIVASTISQLEGVACELRVPTWEKVLNKYPVNPEFYELGRQFYNEEAKHAVAFNRYLDSFAKALNIEPKDLRSFLPQAGNSISKKIYRINSLSGGMAMWWLIAAVEEESIVIHRYIHEVRDKIDPLYLQLHRAHVEEESRHKSYALMMLSLFEEFYPTSRTILFKKIDFLIAQSLNFTWTLKEIVRVKGLKKFRNHHPFFKTLESLMDSLSERSHVEILYQLLTSAPYISNNLQMGDYKHISELLYRFGSVKAPLPKSKVAQEVRCTA